MRDGANAVGWRRFGIAAVAGIGLTGIAWLAGRVTTAADETPPAVSPEDAAAKAAAEKAAKEKAAKDEREAAFRTARELLKPEPRPARPALPQSSLPLQLLDGERVALVGNSTAERMNLFGQFETLLHQRFPDKHLVVRNFARPADEVANRQRGGDYTALDDPLAAFGADTFLLFFGFNETFAGPEGVAEFRTNYEKLLDDLARRYPRDDTGAPPRLRDEAVRG